MAVTLEGITLPTDIAWTNEFSGFGVGQVITPTLTTALVVEEIAQTAGRQISLETGDDSWVERSVVLALDALAKVPLDDTTLTLNWHGTNYDVVFDRSSGAAVEAEEVYQLAGSDQGADHVYSLTLRLITA